MDQKLIALPLDAAVKLTGLSRRQITYWEKTGLLAPEIDARVTKNRKVRLYGLLDLMSLLVVAELRTRDVSLQHVRKIIEHFRERGYERPLTEIRYATHGKSVYFQLPDGAWENDALPKQVVLRDVLDLTPLRRRLDAATRRDPQTVGRQDRRRGLMGGKPVIAGTRVAVETVRSYLDHGASVEQILASFPVLSREDVEMVRRETSVA
jgi:uncharacterized protein (DUF433 family)